MHFRCVFTLLQQCVFTLLQQCVLVGLDWAEPMMLFLLHITCLCIRTFVYLYIDIDIVGAFLCVSFSLSFFH